MTQADLAERIGVTRQTIIAIEQGRYSPSLEVAFQIARVFKVPLDDVFIDANFKETQLTEMRPGQAARVYVDTFRKSYDGHVLNIAGASGARYSLLPPENATGNYVKVVQRIPVKIVFEHGQDPEHLLRPGMSVEPDVNVR